ncbi:MAG: LPXTG cell wall anchor domain-containing protein [Lachnospiraceae bacterium]|jgi:LPXTG-motif cell wall-anchored protein
MKQIRTKNKVGVFALSMLLAASLCSPTAVFAEEPANEEMSQTNVHEGETALNESGEEDAESGEPAQESGTIANAPLKSPEQQQSKIEEPAADSGTTVPNNVNTVVPDDDKKGTDIEYSAEASVWGMHIPLKDSQTTITADDVKSGKTLEEVSEDFKDTEFGKLDSKDLVMNGDLSIKKQGSEEDYDSTDKAAHEAEKGSAYSLQADLDVSAVHNAVNASADLLEHTNFVDAPGAIYVNNLETGLRATISLGDDLDGSFYVPETLEEAQKYYRLTSADGNPMIYRINYANSVFAPDKAVILMDLDLTQMTPLDNTYTNDGSKLYGTNEDGTKNRIENFNHTADEYGDTYYTSNFGNFQKLITSSAKKIRLIIDGLVLKSADGNKTSTETDEEITTTAQGTINGTLVGYVKADLGHNRLVGKTAYTWGAMQSVDGRDVNADPNSDDVSLTVQFTEKEKKEAPVTPVTPDITKEQTDSNVTAVPVKASVNKNITTAAKAEVSPKTGDSGNLNLWFGLMFASVGIGAAGITFRKKQERNR